MKEAWATLVVSSPMRSARANGPMGWPAPSFKAVSASSSVASPEDSTSLQIPCGHQGRKQGLPRSTSRIASKMLGIRRRFTMNLSDRQLGTAAPDHALHLHC